METPEIRLKRLTMRSWRRGMKEMDLILGPFAERGLAALDGARLEAYESLLEENDQDLYRWVSGAAETPAPHADIVSIIAGFHGIRRQASPN